MKNYSSGNEDETDFYGKILKIQSDLKFKNIIKNLINSI